MKRYSIGLIVIVCVVIITAWKSYDLQDGYKLQGFIGTHGWVFYGVFKPVIKSEVMGVQGCKKGYIYGWSSNLEESKYFLINTSVHKVSWLSGNEYTNIISSLGCKKPDMNIEINLSGFIKGGQYVSE